MKMYLLFAAVLLSSTAIGQDIPSREVPSAVINTIKAKFPNTSRLEWEKKGDLFEAEFHVNNIDHKALLDPSGKLLVYKRDIRAADLPHARDGRRVRVAGMVITRQRPGTAKGFVFLTLEDETGISNVIIRPDLYDRDRTVVVRQPFLMVEGVLQHQDGVLSVRAERLEGIHGAASIDAHDFY